MQERLDSTFKYSLPNLIIGTLCLLLGVLCFLALGEAEGWRAAGCVLFGCVWLAGGGLYCIAFLQKWQWVRIDREAITVRCGLYPLRTVPLHQVERCFECKKWLWGDRGQTIVRNCLVMDTVTDRETFAVRDGYNRKDQEYIVMLDTPKNRQALRNLRFHIEKTKPLPYERIAASGGLLL